MIHDPPSEIARDFMRQVDNGCIHTLTPTDHVLREVAAYQRRKRIPIQASVDRTRLLLGLSAIGTGLENIESGRVGDGIAGVRAGYEFLRKELGKKS